MRKLSKVHQLTLLGLSSFALMGCQDDKEEVFVISSPAMCYEVAKTNPDLSNKDCDDAFSAAKAEHQRSAPRYESYELCIEEHGADQCEAAPAVQQTVNNYGSNGGSAFMPFMAGYMISNMMHSSNSGYRHQPVYQTASGSYGTANGQSMFKHMNIKTQTSQAALTTPAKSTFKSPPLTQSQVLTQRSVAAAKAKAATPSVTKASGGFGARSSSGASG